MLSASLSEAIQANKNGKPPSMPSSKSNNDFIATNDDHSFSKASTASASNNIGYMKDLDRVQEQQVVYAGKIEKEKHRQKQLNDSIRAAKQELLDLKALTKNGKIVNEEKAVHGKYLHKLEHQVQQAKIRLSSARGENVSMKKKIDQLRRDKMLYNQIQKDFKLEVAAIEKKNEDGKREVQTINERKHRVKLEIAQIKNKMMTDIEEFAVEMDKAKNAISATQANILNSIRERLNTTVGSTQAAFSPAVKHVKPVDDGAVRVNDFAANQAEISALLSEVNIDSLGDLISGLQTSEETVFSLYKTIQRTNAEVESLDMSNKELESELALQTEKLDSLQSHNDQIKSDLEKNIAAIQKSIGEYEKDYNSHMDVISSVSDDVMTLLGNIAIDEDALDQQLLASGITDRNVDAFLGLIEQRIDDLIQMGKAASRDALVCDDFVFREARPAAQFQAPTVPSLNDLGQQGDDEDELDENARVQPTNISVLKEYMKKRIQKHIKKTSQQANMTAQQQEIQMHAQAAARMITPPGSPGGAGGHMVSARVKTASPVNNPSELEAIRE